MNQGKLDKQEMARANYNGLEWVNSTQMTVISQENLQTYEGSVRLLNTDQHIESVAFQLEKEMATHSNTLAWKIPWTEEPGRLWSMGSLRVGHD